MTFFSGDLDKLAPENYRAFLDFNEARDDRLAVSSAGPKQIICTSDQTDR